jgi:hypothetical protein
MRLFTFSPIRVAAPDLSDPLNKRRAAATKLRNSSNHFIGYALGLTVQLRDEAAHLAAAICVCDRSLQTYLVLRA